MLLTAGKKEPDCKIARNPQGGNGENGPNLGGGRRPVLGGIPACRNGASRKIGTQTFFRLSDCRLTEDNRAKRRFASLFFSVPFSFQPVFRGSGPQPPKTGRTLGGLLDNAETMACPEQRRRDCGDLSRRFGLPPCDPQAGGLSKAAWRPDLRRDLTPHSMGSASSAHPLRGKSQFAGWDCAPWFAGGTWAPMSSLLSSAGLSSSCGPPSSRIFMPTL